MLGKVISRAGLPKVISRVGKEFKVLAKGLSAGQKKREKTAWKFYKQGRERVKHPCKGDQQGLES